MVDLPVPPAHQPRRFGTYTTYREIARGGQGAVLEAMSDLGERVALKVLIHPSATGRKRFEQEAQVLLRLSHPNLIQIRDLGERNGFPFLAMEFVDGQDLQDIVDGRGIPDIAWSAEVMAFVADAVEYCHEQGIVHRDIKPGNVLIERGTRRPVLVDFGLVKRDAEQMRLSELDDATTQFSRSGELRGTPCFMSPEQAHPTKCGPISPATDVYALGATLYYLLTGQPPIEEGATASVLYHVVATPPVDPRKHNPEVPGWLAELCLECLEKVPSDRPGSAAEVAEALRRQPPEAFVVEPRRPPPLVAITVALLVGIGLGVGVGLPLGRGLAPEPPEPPPPIVITATPSPAPAAAAVAPVVTDVEPLKSILETISKHMQLKQHKQAIAACDRVLSRAEAGSQEYRTALRRRGWAFFQLGKWERGAADHSESLGYRPLDYGLWFDRGRMKAHGSDDAGALKDYDRALELRPRYQKGYYTRGRLRRKMKDLEGAFVDFTRAIDLDPGDWRSWSERGWTRLTLKRYDEALVDYDQALILEPVSEHARIGRGMVHRAAGDLKRAQRDFDWVIEKGKALQARAYAHRALVKLQKKEMDSALADAEKAVELDPKQALTWRYRGDVRRIRGELTEALADYAKALEIMPTYAAVIAARGMVRLRQGHRTLAKKDLERGLDTMPGWEWIHEEAKKTLEGLR